MKIVKKSVVAATGLALLASAALTGCSEPASDVVSKNLSTAADNFEVQRKIVGVNGITDKVAFEVVGRCSISREDKALIVTCKHGDNDYRKHIVGLSDNTFYVSSQLGPIDVSVYHTRIIVRPETLIPEIGLDMGKQ